jgi:5-formyltetrahydrofolate cyclo-ligase
VNKTDARRVARERLANTSPGYRAESALEIRRNLLKLPELTDARTVMVYAPLAGEVPLDEVTIGLRERGVALVYPRCLDAGRLGLHRVDSEELLVESGRYRIREPSPDCPVVNEDEIDVALVPGLAWSRDGTRLGRGAGYYDRLLASSGWRGLRCGVFFAIQEMAALPRDPWDVRLDVVVTELGIVRAP